ncbi:hypothetical protein [Microvirga tunisiensis]|uniref:hypothetical protein n=1 Tax=Microvirga tunisiensis TaxID=2108360 RepID=UPI0013A5331A|nr:hypothetical protein [Microvirga tunisiensis]
MSQGIPASPANARILFKLVQTEGSANTKIEVAGFDPMERPSSARTAPESTTAA